MCGVFDAEGGEKEVAFLVMLHRYKYAVVNIGRAGRATSGDGAAKLGPHPSPGQKAWRTRWPSPIGMGHIRMGQWRRHFSPGPNGPLEKQIGD